MPDWTPAPDFHFDYPVWTLWDENTSRATTVDRRDIGRCLMIFTDLDLAQRFIEVRPKPGVIPMGILHPKELIDFAELCRQTGTTHVSIDFSFSPKPSGGLQSTSNPTATIAFFIETVTKCWREQGEP
jgi:hypothetical protein